MTLDLKFYWKLLLRRLPVMAVFLLLCAGLGGITAMKLPETWSAEARLLVEAPQIPDEMVRSTVQTDAIEQLDIIQQRLLTRANLIDIANRFNVFEDMRGMEPDTVLAQMRAATRVRRTAGRDQATLLTISFEARTGRIAADVVNEFVTLVLEENASFRRTRAEGTLQFFVQEVADLEADLNAQSALISQFKSDNMGALPENQDYRLGRQALLQERLERLERERSVYEAQREDFVRIYETTGRVLRDGQANLSINQQRLAEAETQLSLELARYSETHPNIQRLRAQIERLEEIVATEAAADLPAEGNISAEEAMLNATLAEIDTRLEFVLNDIAGTREELEELEEAIARSAGNAIALNDLEREYQIIESRYAAAVGNLNAAQMSERIEATAQGQRITVIENATVPQVPTGPNRIRIAAAGIAAGLGLAGGYFMLLELLNRTIRRPAELIGRFNVTPITTIPYMESRRHRFMRRAGLLGGTAVVLVSVPLALWYIDSYYMPLEILVQRGLSRFGFG
jgi:polysaccharide chain length determinant protein (PEP-CTERM system associated)